MEDVKEKISHFISLIKKHHMDFVVEAERFRLLQAINSFDKYNCDSWCTSVVGDGLIKLRLLIEQNFNFIETMGLTITSRYIFELSIWISLFSKDKSYGLLYYKRLIDNNEEFFKAYKAQIEFEIQSFEKFDAKNEELKKEAIQGNRNSINKDECHFIKLTSDLDQIEKNIDLEASSFFSIYAEDAIYNGYSYQAHLLRKEVIPKIEQKLNEIDQEKSLFKNHISNERSITDSMRKRLEAKNQGGIKWDKLAEEAGLKQEYDFIYKISSKLIHAGPMSITTNQKNLGQEEALIFLKYIDFKLRSTLDLVKKSNFHVV